MEALEDAPSRVLIGESNRGGGVAGAVAVWPARWRCGRRGDQPVSLRRRVFRYDEGPALVLLTLLTLKWGSEP